MKHLQKSLSLFLCIVLCLLFFPFTPAYAEENIEEVESVSEAEELEQMLIQDETAFDEDQEAQPHDHSYIAVVTEPTCTEQGYTTYTCDCGDSYVDDYIDALNHPEIVDVLEVPATEAEPGTTAGKKCTVCGEVLEGCEEIPVLEEVVTENDAQQEDDSLIAKEKEKSVAFETIVEEETVSSVAKSAVVHSGTWGDNITWMLDENGLLIISGSGAMNPFYPADGSSQFSGSGAWLEYKADIKEAVLEYGITSIGRTAFSGCSNLKTITIPSSVTEIGFGAFYICSGLTSITIPDSVTTIYNFAFAGTSIKHFSIPEKTIFIGEGVFNTRYLESITVKPGNTQFFTDSNGILYDRSHTEDLLEHYYYDYTILACPKIFSGDLIIDSNVTAIASHAFAQCTNLTAITMPVGLQTIGQNAFSNSGLKEIRFLGGPPSRFAGFNNITAI